IYVAAGAFLLGWLVGKVGAYFGNKFSARNRDPRDDRIRSMVAELRIARTDADKAKAELEEQSKTLKEEEETVVARDKLISEQVEIISRLRADLKESVLKTRELRMELTDRAAENIKSEVRLRDVETELSVAQASTDMLATGVLDYTTTEDD
ncbi:MAG: hypothetical protein IH912_11910, partial [Proteobacteria bacterium]|nr:hypothetical protein [Pseudomonadota bacterium]